MHIYSLDHLQCQRQPEVLEIFAQQASVDEFYCEYAVKEAIRHNVCIPTKAGIPKKVCKIIKALQLPKVDA